VRLEHILLAAREAIGFARGKTLADLEHDRLLVRALLHAILEIGEAAANVGPESRAIVVDVPWSDIVRMRNVLIHVYWGVRVDKLWATVERDLPRLIEAIERGTVGWPLGSDRPRREEVNSWVLGADGAKGGAWMAFRVRDGVYEPCLYRDTSELWIENTRASLILLDVPIGLPDSPCESLRACDVHARQFVGARWASVFAAPARWMLSCSDLTAADAEKARRLRAAGVLRPGTRPPRVTRQVFVGMVPRIRDVDSLLQRDEEARQRIRECHPEVCFAALAGRHLEHSKHTERGLQERRAILDRHVPAIDFLVQAARGDAERKRISVAADDILDALVVAVTAAGSVDQLRTLPADPPRDSCGLAMEMVYRSPFAGVRSA
jgi:predicted RNase H-like nuclease/uncharacterized protein with HEPN domain